MTRAFRWFVGSLPLMFISLVLATAAWIVAAEEDDPTITGTFSDAIPVETVGLAGGLVVVGDVDEDVIVTISAPQTVWQLLEAADFRASVDLTGLDMGIHDVPIDVTVNESPARLDYTPDHLAVEIAVKAEQELPVVPEYEGSLAIGYEVETAAVTPTLAVVSGPGSYVIDVVKVSAVIDLQDATANIEAPVELVALDAEGRQVPYVAISPATAHASVQVKQARGYRTLTIDKPESIGEVAPGYQVTGVSIEPPAVTVVGSPEAIADLQPIIEALPINIDGAQEDVVVVAELDVPPGVTLVPGTEVEITVHVEAKQGSRTIVVQVEMTGLGLGLTADLSSETAEVLLEGPVPVLDNLGPSDVRVIVDLTGLAPGTHSIEPQVNTPDGITYSLIFPTTTLQVEIRSSATPTPGGG